MHPRGGEKIMTDKNSNYHVVPHGTGWAARREQSSRASSQHGTQREAINAGRNLAKKTHGELRIHRADGTIRDSDSYGNDPFPPRDRRN